MSTGPYLSAEQLELATESSFPDDDIEVLNAGAEQARYSQDAEHQPRCFGHRLTLAGVEI